MSGATSIEWTDATWNPVRGCSRVSEGCRNCYAERVAARFAGDGQPFAGFAGVLADVGGFGRPIKRMVIPRWTGRVELIPEKLDEPLRWKKPRRIFVNSMSDLFHEKLSDEAIAAVFGVMAACLQHTFQVLTKRPERMRAWFEWVAKELRGEAAGLLDCTTDALGLTVAGLGEFYARSRDASWPLPNVWLGVSVENQATADERIPLLLQTPAALRFVSYEPAIGPVDFNAIQIPGEREGLRFSALQYQHDDRFGSSDTLLDWIIVGGESGPGARPFNHDWARSAIAQCREATVPVFVKQMGSVWIAQYARARGISRWNRKGGDPSEWPEDLRVREFPAVREAGEGHE